MPDAPRFLPARNRGRLITVAVPWAVTTTLLVLAPLLGQDAVGQGEPPVTGMAIVALIAAIGIGQVVMSLSMHGGRSATLVWLLLAEAVLTFLPALLGEQVWVVMLGMLAATALLALPGLGAACACLLILVAQILLQAASGQHAPRAPLTTVAIFAIGFGLRVLAWLACAVIELSRDQRRLADSAVRTERLRFSRDLHDTLVHDLAVIALRSELALTSVPHEARQARAEIERITDLARTATANVRTVASGYRRLSLRDEIDGALGILTEAGISCTAQIAHLPEDRPGVQVFAWAIREGATNILRHSEARTCAVRTMADDGQISLELVNDGGRDAREADTAADSPRSAGSGLAGLAERADALGGRLSHGTDQYGHFWLRVDLPTQRPARLPRERAADPGTS